jgi:LemA protein
MELGVIILIAVVVIGAFLVLVYNGLIRARNHVKEAWADIEVQLKRRYNLIPNLVETVKGYASHENKTFQQVTQARAEAMKAHSPAEQAKAEANLSAMIGNLIAVAENYPELKASSNFQSLQDELTDTENKIQASRRFFNNQVLNYNNKLEVFPTNVIGGMFKFKSEEFFELEDEAQRENPKVSF